MRFCNISNTPWLRRVFIYIFLRLGLEPYNFCTNPETAETPLEGRLGGYSLQAIQCFWYTHKTSGYKTSGFKTSGFKTSGFKTSET